MTINRRHFLTASGAFAAQAIAGAEFGAPRDDGKRPNLLLIQPDQFRIHALGIWRRPEFRSALRTASDPVHTPALDSLATESVLFNRACATAPVCSPSRAMFLSGMYPSRNGVSANCMEGSPQGLHDDAICLTDILSRCGYEAALVGKAHWERNQPLFDSKGNYFGTTVPPGGHTVNPFDTYIPRGRGRHGSRFWFQTIHRTQFETLAYSSDSALVGGKTDGEPSATRGFSATIEADVVIRYLKNQGHERDPEKPFCLMWNPLPPHTPYDSIEDCEQDIYEQFYKDLPLDQLLNRPNVDVEKANRESNLEVCTRVYFSLVSSIDRQVGRVLQALEESGAADNTIVVFTSDHGEMMGSHGLFAKSVIYEEAFLIPLMIRFPNELKPRTDDLMMGRVDLMPTLLALMNLKDRIPASVQGVDRSPDLRAARPDRGQRPTSAVYLMDNGKGIRTDRYTYCVGQDGHTQLYDLFADPYQRANLALSSIPHDELQILQQELGNWLKVAADPWYRSRDHARLIAYPS